MSIRIFIYQHAYMKLKIYKYFYGEITILPQMRTYLIYRAYRTDKYALYSDSRWSL